MKLADSPTERASARTLIPRRRRSSRMRSPIWDTASSDTATMLPRRTAPLYALTWRDGDASIQLNGCSTKELIKAMADDELSRTFAALADPTRRAILARPAGGEATGN